MLSLIRMVSIQVITRSLFRSIRTLKISESCALCSGADVNIADDRGRTPLHVARGSIIKLLVAHESTMVNIQDAQGLTPLHYAAGQRKFPCDVRALLEHKDINPNVRQNDGLTPLLYVAKSRYDVWGVVEALLAHPGLDINAHELEVNGRSALQYLVEKREWRAIQHFATHPDLDASEEVEPGKRLLEYALDKVFADRYFTSNSKCCDFGHVIHELVKKVPTDANFCTDNWLRVTPLFAAIHLQNIRLVEYLLTFESVDVNERAHRRLTPLQYSQHCNRDGNISKMLTDHGVIAKKSTQRSDMIDEKSRSEQLRDTSTVQRSPGEYRPTERHKGSFCKCTIL